MTNSEIIAKLALNQTEVASDEFNISGTTPASILSTDIKKVITVFGITPEDFVNTYSSVEFDFNLLMNTFNNYCKDFDSPLTDGQPSYALEFSAKMLFELGTYIRNEKKSKGDKAVRFRFPYKKDERLSIKVVIVTTFRDMVYKKMEDAGKMVITFKQAALLSVVTFTKAISYAFSKDASILMTPLCGAVFSRESIPAMAMDLKKEQVEVIKIINESTCSGGQYLPSSDMSCAIVAMIHATKRITNPNVRNMMITKVIKQYAAKHKTYVSDYYNIYAKYALGGVPPGLDAETLIQNYSNIQTNEINMRAQVLAQKQSVMKISLSEPPIVPGTPPLPAPQPTYHAATKDKHTGKK